jgi:TolA-binding protein
MRMKPCDIGSEAAERYVVGSMDESERTSFEDHFFACQDCFFTVQALETARGVLAGGSSAAESAKAGGWLRGAARGLPLQWMAAAAALIVVVGLSVMTRQGSSPTPVRPEVVAEVPIAAPHGAVSTAPPPAPAVAAPAPTPAASARQTSEGRLERWARVVPPQYVALPSRSGQERDAEENSRRFDEAMTHYSAGRHREAADGLQVLADRTPAAAHVQFFLGISELMADNVSRARGALQRSADSGVNPYADEAHFYLAKVALRAGDLTTAARVLGIAVEREAGPEDDAAKLRAELRAVREP